MKRRFRQTVADLPNSSWQEFLADPGERNFVPVYESCKGMVWTLCMRITGRYDEAMDAFQSTWCRLLAEARDRTDRSLDFSDGRQTVYRLAIREAQNLRKRSSRRAGKEMAVETFDTIPSGDPPADEQAARKQLREQLEMIVRLLPEDLRLALQLNLFHGLSPSEISRATNVSPSTVSRRLSKGMKELGKLLRRAGLVDALKGATALGAGAVIFSPPEAFSASIIFAKAQAALATSAAAAATTGLGAAGAKISSGLLIMKTKIGIVVAIAALGIIGITGTMAIQKYIGAPAAQSIESTAIQPQIAINTRSRMSVAKTSQSLVATSSTENWAISSLPATTPTTGSTIVGQVIDSEAKRPIAGAVIQVKNMKGVSNPNGFYELKGIASKQVNASASAKGYAVRPAIINIPATNRAVQNFSLDPAIEITVQVVDTKDAPITSATIEAFGIREGFIDDVGVTDVHGKAVVPAMSRLKLPVFFARKVGFKEIEREDRKVQVNPEKTHGTVKLTLESVGDMMRAITGRMTDKQGKPIPKVNVQWSPVSGKQEGRDKVLTDESGNYVLVFENEAKDCKLSVFGEGWAPAIREDVIAGTTDKPAVENFSIEEGHWLKGTVVDESDKPVAGVGVYSMPMDHINDNWSYPGVERNTKTDANGMFSLKDIPGPRIALELRKKGWTNLSHNDQEIDRDVKFMMKGMGVIAGRVIDKETRQPLPTFNIKMNGSGVIVSRRNPGESFTSPDGAFVLKDLPQDAKYRLVIEADGYIAAERANVSSQAEPKATRLEIKLSRGREISGFLVDAATKEAVNNAVVNFGVWDGADLQWFNIATSRSVTNGQKTNVDSSGRFKFKEDEPGTIFIQAKGYRKMILKPEDRAKFQMNPQTLWLPLQKGESVRGTYYENGRPAKGYVGLLRRDRALQVIGSCDTPDDGRFEWNDLEPGMYELMTIWRFREIMPIGMIEVFHRFDLKEGARKQVNFGEDLGKMTFAGRVTDPQGKPLDRVELVLKPAFDWPYSFRAYLYSKGGCRFIFPNLKPGRYTLELQQNRTYSSDPAHPVSKTKSLPPIEITGNLERDLQVEPVR